MMKITTVVLAIGMLNASSCRANKRTTNERTYVVPIDADHTMVIRSAGAGKNVRDDLDLMSRSQGKMWSRQIRRGQEIAAIGRDSVLFSASEYSSESPQLEYASLKDGSQVWTWSAPTGEAYVMRAILYQGGVYVRMRFPDWTAMLFAIDPKTGQKQWQLPMTELDRMVHYVGDFAVYFSSEHQAYRFVRLRTGEVVLSQQSATRGICVTDSDVWLDYADQLVRIRLPSLRVSRTDPLVAGIRRFRLTGMCGTRGENVVMAVQAVPYDRPVPTAGLLAVNAKTAVVTWYMSLGPGHYRDPLNSLTQRVPETLPAPIRSHLALSGEVPRFVPLLLLRSKEPSPPLQSHTSLDVVDLDRQRVSHSVWLPRALGISLLRRGSTWLLRILDTWLSFDGTQSQPRAAATSAEPWVFAPWDKQLMWHARAPGVVADLATLTSDTDGALTAQPPLLRLPRQGDLPAALATQPPQRKQSDAGHQPNS